MNYNIKIRRIQEKDNAPITKIIKSTLEEFDAAIEGTAYTDKETNEMYQAYLNDKSVYYVAVLNDEIVAGCGINQLKNEEEDTCELQKMYMLPKARGLKIGKQLLLKCLSFAKNAGYKKCYLETFPNMKSAISLYTKNGFEYIDQPMGNTCHYSCDVWMIKNL